MSKNKDKNNNSFYELLKTLFYAGTIAVLFRSILFEPFNIPSGSMIPSLLVGDYLFVSKYSYGYSRYSFPFGILPIKDRLIYDVPQRGDIIVFRKPGDEQVDYIKRLIGLPGDTIQVLDGRLYINDKLVNRKKTNIGQITTSDGNKINLIEYEEKILRKVFEWPKIIESASYKLEPHKIPFYLYDLSNLFHSYWSKGNEDDKFRFIENNKLKRHETLIFIILISIVIENGMNILGVSLPKKM